MVQYAERLAASLPDELESCIFVCSGTEANDLAYQIARTVTGHKGAVASEGIYHGNSIAVTEVSLSESEIADRPDHIRAIPVPDTYRGDYGGEDPDSGQKYAALAATAIDELAASRHGLAMAIIDPIFDAPGIFTAPRSYLPDLFDRVRAAGGLTVVDEIQSGLCRLGDNMWGFQDSGVVPDIVTMGKPMGNGHPLAAVVAKRWIMEAFAKSNGYFNTFGGNPVSAAVGNAVLDVIEDSNILKNVHTVGQHLKNGLQQLHQRYDVVGDVRGKGFFLGLELVADRKEKSPAPTLAHNLANTLRHNGVLVSVNGTYDNVIKIRPPLVFSDSDADQLISALDIGLSRLNAT